ncbi:MAG: DNA mismatch endonuclease Vsr [Chitinophagaceae bacterium]|nr:MAG: DNA mismatch endonuclease Vsr [Chitinophagaceae bacterium]
MFDEFDPPVTPQRSALMSRVRGKNSTPERLVRSELHKLGYRFRLHVTGLPGKPDIVLPSRRAIVLVHGCFWHRHIGCRLASNPKTRISFWESKFATNVARDRRTRSMLKKLGWAVHVVWECETKKGPKYLARLVRFLDRNPACDPRRSQLALMPLTAGRTRKKTPLPTRTSGRS